MSNPNPTNPNLFPKPMIGSNNITTNSNTMTNNSNTILSPLELPLYNNNNNNNQGPLSSYNSNNFPSPNGPSPSNYIGGASPTGEGETSQQQFFASISKELRELKEFNPGPIQGQGQGQQGSYLSHLESVQEGGSVTLSEDPKGNDSGSQGAGNNILESNGGPGPGSQYSNTAMSQSYNNNSYSQIQSQSVNGPGNQIFNNNTTIQNQMNQNNSDSNLNNNNNVTLTGSDENPSLNMSKLDSKSNIESSNSLSINAITNSLNTAGNTNNSKTNSYSFSYTSSPGPSITISPKSHNVSVEQMINNNMNMNNFNTMRNNNNFNLLNNSSSSNTTSTLNNTSMTIPPYQQQPQPPLIASTIPPSAVTTESEINIRQAQTVESILNPNSVPVEPSQGYTTPGAKIAPMVRKDRPKNVIVINKTGLQQSSGLQQSQSTVQQEQQTQASQQSHYFGNTGFLPIDQSTGLPGLSQPQGINLNGNVHQSSSSNTSSTSAFTGFNKSGNNIIVNHQTIDRSLNNIQNIATMHKNVMPQTPATPSRTFDIPGNTSLNAQVTPGSNPIDPTILTKAATEGTIDLQKIVNQGQLPNMVQNQIQNLNLNGNNNVEQSQNKFPSVSIQGLDLVGVQKPQPMASPFINQNNTNSGLNTPKTPSQTSNQLQQPLSQIGLKQGFQTSNTPGLSDSLPTPLSVTMENYKNNMRKLHQQSQQMKMSNSYGKSPGPGSCGRSKSLEPGSNLVSQSMSDVNGTPIQIPMLKRQTLNGPGSHTSTQRRTRGTSLIKGPSPYVDDYSDVDPKFGANQSQSKTLGMGVHKLGEYTPSNTIMAPQFNGVLGMKSELNNNMQLAQDMRDQSLIGMHEKNQRDNLIIGNAIMNRVNQNSNQNSNNISESDPLPVLDPYSHINADGSVSMKGQYSSEKVQELREQQRLAERYAELQRQKAAMENQFSLMGLAQGVYGIGVGPLSQSMNLIDGKGNNSPIHVSMSNSITESRSMSMSMSQSVTSPSRSQSNGPSPVSLLSKKQTIKLSLNPNISTHRTMNSMTKGVLHQTLIQNQNSNQNQNSSLSNSGKNFQFGQLNAPTISLPMTPKTPTENQMPVQKIPTNMTINSQTPVTDDQGGPIHDGTDPNIILTSLPNEIVYIQPSDSDQNQSQSYTNTSKSRSMISGMNTNMAHWNSPGKITQIQLHSGPPSPKMGYNQNMNNSESIESIPSEGAMQGGSGPGPGPSLAPDDTQIHPIYNTDVKNVDWDVKQMLIGNQNKKNRSKSNNSLNGTMMSNLSNSYQGSSSLHNTSQHITIQGLPLPKSPLELQEALDKIDLRSFIEKSTERTTELQQMSMLMQKWQQSQSLQQMPGTGTGAATPNTVNNNGNAIPENRFIQSLPSSDSFIQTKNLNIMSNQNQNQGTGTGAITPSFPPPPPLTPGGSRLIDLPKIEPFPLCPLSTSTDILEKKKAAVRERSQEIQIRNGGSNTLGQQSQHLHQLQISTPVLVQEVQNSIRNVTNVKDSIDGNFDRIKRDVSQRIEEQNRVRSQQCGIQGLSIIKDPVTNGTKLVTTASVVQAQMIEQEQIQQIQNQMMIQQQQQIEFEQSKSQQNQNQMPNLEEKVTGSSSGPVQSQSAEVINVIDINFPNDQKRPMPIPQKVLGTTTTIVEQMPIVNTSTSGTVTTQNQPPLAPPQPVLPVPTQQQQQESSEELSHKKDLLQELSKQEQVMRKRLHLIQFETHLLRVQMEKEYRKAKRQTMKLIVENNENSGGRSIEILPQKASRPSSAMTAAPAAAPVTTSSTNASILKTSAITQGAQGPDAVVESEVPSQKLNLNSAKQRKSRGSESQAVDQDITNVDDTAKDKEKKSKKDKKEKKSQSESQKSESQYYGVQEEDTDYKDSKTITKDIKEKKEKKEKSNKKSSQTDYVVEESMGGLGTIIETPKKSKKEKKESSKKDSESQSKSYYDAGDDDDALKTAGTSSKKSKKEKKDSSSKLQQYDESNDYTEGPSESRTSRPKDKKESKEKQRSSSITSNSKKTSKNRKSSDSESRSRSQSRERESGSRSRNIKESSRNNDDSELPEPKSLEKDRSSSTSAKKSTKKEKKSKSSKRESE